MMAGMLMTVSCRNDDKDEEVTSVIGNWKVQKMITKGAFTSGGFTVPINNSSESSCVKESKVDLNGDKTGHALVKDDTTGTCEVLGDENFTYTYNPETKIITVKSNGTSQDIKVIKVTNSELTIEQPADMQTPQGTFNGTITLNMTK